MGILLKCCLLALRDVVDGACQRVGLTSGGEGITALVAFLPDHFPDHSQRLTGALGQAQARAWRALEIALGGEPFWSRLDRSEDRAFRQQVRAFLDATPLAGLPSHGAEFRQ